MERTSQDSQSRVGRVVNIGTARLENLYRRVTKDQPESPRSLHVKSILAMQNGRHDEAARLIGQAAVLDPADADHQRQLGMTCHLPQSLGSGPLVHARPGLRCRR